MSVRLLSVRLWHGCKLQLTVRSGVSTLFKTTDAHGHQLSCTLYACIACYSQHRTDQCAVWFCCAQCVIAHLENADVARLLRIFQYVQRYEADWEVAWLQAEQKEAEERKNEPMMVDEDMLGEFKSMRKVKAACKYSLCSRPDASAAVLS